MTPTEIVQKIIGNITPAGETHKDTERLENLKEMCALVNNLVGYIDAVAYLYKDSHMHSIRTMSEYAQKFLTKELGIETAKSE